MSSEFLTYWPLLESGLYQRWTLTLLHFLWQGALVGLSAWLCCRLLHRSSAEARYATCLIAFFCLPICVAATFFSIDVHAEPPAHASRAVAQVDTTNLKTVAEPVVVVAISENAPSMIGVSVGLSEDSTATEVPETADVGSATESSDIAILTAAAPFVTTFYALGVGYFLLRLLAAVCGSIRLRIAGQLVSDKSIIRLLEQQTAALGLRVAPLVAYCERVAVPTVIGVVRPMVLLPTSVMNGLHADELALILRHELAHIRRYDLLVNLLQRVLESVLFFHPVVWLISRRISEEREGCCDDMVVRSGCGRFEYVNALLRMAELCIPGERQLAALAIFGRDTTEFERRIHRLLAEHAKPRTGFPVMGLVLAFAIILSMATASAVLRSDESNGSNEPEATGIQPDERAEGEPDSGSITPTLGIQSEDPVLLLAQLKQRDALFDNRTLEVEQVWIEKISPEALLAQRQFNDFKFGQRNQKYPNPKDLPDDYDQPHRKLQRLTVKEPEVTLETVRELERRIRNEYGVIENAGFRWSSVGGIEQSYSPTTNTLHTTGPARKTGVLRMYHKAFECCCGYGFGKRLTKIESVERIASGLRVKGIADLIGDNKTKVELDLDGDFIVRKAVFAIPGRTGGTDEYHFETEGTQDGPDSLRLAKKGRYRRILKPLDRPENVSDDYEVVFRSLSSHLTPAQYRQATELKPRADAARVDLTPRKRKTTEEKSDETKKDQSDAAKKQPSETTETIGGDEKKDPETAAKSATAPVDLASAVAIVNAEVTGLPYNVDVPRLTVDTVVSVIRKLNPSDDFSIEEVRVLQRLADTGKIPSNVTLRHFYRYDTGHSMQHGSWVRLMLTRDDSGPYSLQLRAKVAFDRPYTQKERMFRKAMAPFGMVAMGRLVTYFRTDPQFETSVESTADYSALIADVRAALKTGDVEALENLFHWKGVHKNDPVRAFVKSELQQVIEQGVAKLTFSPRRYAGELFQWQVHHTYGPNAPVEGFLNFTLQDTDGQLTEPLRLEVGSVDGQPRFVCHIVVDNKLKDWLGKKMTAPISVTGFHLAAPDGKIEQGTTLTAPDEMAPLRQANREIWLRGPDKKRIDQRASNSQLRPAAADPAPTRAPKNEKAETPLFWLMAADEPAARAVARRNADAVLFLNAMEFFTDGVVNTRHAGWDRITDGLKKLSTERQKQRLKTHVRMFFDNRAQVKELSATRPTNAAVKPSPASAFRQAVTEKLSGTVADVAIIDSEYRNDDATWADRVVEMLNENLQAEKIDRTRYKKKYSLTEDGLAQAFRDTAGFAVFSPKLSSAIWTLGTVGKDEFEIFAAMLLPHLKQNAAEIHSKKRGEELEFTVATRDRCVEVARQITIALWRLSDVRKGKHDTWSSPVVAVAADPAKLTPSGKEFNERLRRIVPAGTVRIRPSAVVIPGVIFVTDGQSLDVLDHKTGEKLAGFFAEDESQANEKSTTVILGLVFVWHRDQLWVLSQESGAPLARFAAKDLSQLKADAESRTLNVRADAASVTDPESNSPQKDSEIPAVKALLERVASQKRSGFGRPRLHTENDTGRITELRFRDTKLSDTDFSVIADLSELTKLDLSDSNVTNDQLSHVGKLTRLQNLNLMDTAVSDKGLPHLSELKLLHTLDLRRTKVTDAGLAHLQQLAALRHLGLRGCPITDVAAEALLKMPGLVSLKLGDTPLTDAGLQKLMQLPALRGLTLDETKVTQKGLQSLAELPTFTWVDSSHKTVEEVARRLVAGEFQSIHWMESIGLLLPSRGKFSNPTITANPQPDRNRKRRIKRLRLELDWISDPGRKLETFYADLMVDRGAVGVMQMGISDKEDRVRKPKKESATKPDVDSKESRVPDEKDDAEQGGDSANLQPESPASYLARRVSIKATDVRMSKVLADIAQSAGLKLEPNQLALKEVGLDLSQPISTQIDDLSLQDALAEIIRWRLHPGAFHEIRGNRLVLTTLTAWQESTAAKVPDILKPFHDRKELTIRFDHRDHVTSIYSGRLSDDILAVLPKLPHLRTLELSGVDKVTDRGLDHLAQLKQLESLQLSRMLQDGRPLADGILKRIVNIPSIRRLDLRESGTSNDGARLLEKLPGLQELFIYQEGNLKNAGLQSIGRLSSLRKLSLIAYVRALPFDWMKFSEEGMRHLSGMKNLEHLSLAGQPVPVAILKMPELKSLDTGRFQLTSEHIKELAQLKQLNKLAVQYTGTDEGLSPLGKLQQLRELSLSLNQMTESGLAPISKLKDLRSLTLSIDRISASGLANLTTLQELGLLSITSAGFDDASLSQIAKLQSLAMLSLSEQGYRNASSESHLTPLGFKSLSRLPHLRSVSLTKACPKPSDVAFAQLKSLRTLRLSDTGLTPAEFQRVSAAAPQAVVSDDTLTGYRRSTSSWLNGKPIDSAATLVF